MLLFPWGKKMDVAWPETDHSPPNGAEIKNEWSFNCTSPYTFVSWCFSKHSDICTVSALKCHSASITIAPIFYLELSALNFDRP
jgi:hypothetical protein